MNKKNVLYLDDDKDQRDLMGRYLGKVFPGYDIHLLERGSEAIAVLKSVDGKISAFFTDYNLMGETGLDVLHEATGHFLSGERVYRAVISGSSQASLPDLVAGAKADFFPRSMNFRDDASALRKGYETFHGI
ncbi:MAG: hypothetical protein ABIH82_06335 [Candidatus Woesearchaeota archaeon]